MWRGMPIVDIADLRQFQGQVRVNESDISGVEVGNAVRVRVRALPGQTFSGRIKRVTSVAAQISRQDPRKYFLCDVILDVPLEFMEKLKPGIQLTAPSNLTNEKGSWWFPRVRSSGGTRISLCS